MSVKTRIAQLNTRLADTLTAKGVDADGSETTTALIDKVSLIEQSGAHEASALSAMIERNASSVTIPDGVTKIGYYAFYYWDTLKSIMIPDGVTSIGGSAFYNCTALESVTIPDGVTSIGNGAFSQCIALKSVSIPESVISIGSTAFSRCSVLESITIPHGVTIINSSMFSQCYALESVTIPDGVTTVGSYVFSECTALKSVTCLAQTPPTIQSTSFTRVPADCAIYVPAASVDAYKAATNWSARADYIQAIV